MARKHYCEQCKGNKESHFMSGVMFGTILGGIIGVLFAPAPGEKTRKKLKEVSEDLSEKGNKVLDEAKEVVEDVKVAASPLVAELEKNMAPVLKKAKAQGKDVQFQVLEKVEQLVDEAEDVAEDAGKNMKKFFRGVKK